MALLSVAAVGVEPLDYQWFLGLSGDIANPISGATAASYTTPALTADAAYWVRAGNAHGAVDSQTAFLAVESVSFQVLAASTNGLMVEMAGLPETRWQVQRSTDLLTWEPVAMTDLVLPESGRAIVMLPVGPDWSWAFYRAMAVP